MLFRGDDDAGAIQTYGEIEAVFTDVSASSEDSDMKIKAVIAGSLTEVASFGSSGNTLSRNTVVASGYTLKVNTTTDYGATLNVAAQTQTTANVAAFLAYGDHATASRVDGIKSRGAGAGDHTIVQDGDALLEIRGRGSNGSSYQLAGVVSIEVDGTPGSGADMPGRITFDTTPDGSSTPTERMRIDNAGIVNIGGVNATTPFAGLAAHAVLESTANAGLSILSGTSNAGRILFGDTADSDVGGFLYNHSTDDFSITVSAAERMRIDSSGAVFIGDTANASMTQGITASQGSADDEIISLKSSDIAHGMTAATETDTFGALGKATGAAGGLSIRGYRDAGGNANKAIEILAVLGEAADTTDTTSSLGVCDIQASVKSGTSRTSVGSTGNVLTVTNFGTTRVLVKGDGTVHASDTSWATALDDVPDAIAGRALVTQNGLLDGYKVHAPQLVSVLEERGVVTPAEDGNDHRFINLQKATKFSWDMGFQNFLFLWEVVKRVMTPEQIEELPDEFKAGIRLLEAV
jgi:hypothetical protein